MKPRLIGVVLLTTACAGVGSKVVQIQTECDTSHPEFIVFVDCLQTLMRDITNTRDGDLVRLYLAEAGLLAVKVEYNQLDEEIARYELEKKLAILQRESSNRDSARIRAFGQGLTKASENMRAAAPSPPIHQPTRTNCIVMAGIVNCTTW